MKRFFATLLTFSLIAAIVPFVVHADDHTPSDSQSKSSSENVVIVGPDEVIERNHFAAGDVVEISGTIQGDLFVAGGQVTVNGTVEGDVLAAGGSVRISGTVTDDVRVAGGEVIISGAVNGNVTAAGGSVDITEGAFVGESVIIGGGSVVIAGPISGHVTAGAGSLTLSSAIGGDVWTDTGSIRVSPQATIEGTLSYSSQDEELIDENAQVGSLEKRDSRYADEVSSVAEMAPEKIAQVMGAVRAGFKITSVISALIVGLVMVKLVPNFLSASAKTLDKKPWASLGIGFLIAFVTPIVGVLLIVTLIAIPVAGILFAHYAIYIYFAKIFVSFWVGTKILKNAKRGLQLTAGLLIFGIVTFIPIIGGLISLATLGLGLGTAYLTLREFHGKARADKLL